MNRCVLGDGPVFHNHLDPDLLVGMKAIKVIDNINQVCCQRTVGVGCNGQRTMGALIKVKHGPFWKDIRTVVYYI